MSQIEKRLWLIWISVFAIAAAASAGLLILQHRSIETFPDSQLSLIRRAMRPERVARKFEQTASVEGIQILRVMTTSTNIRVSRSEANRDLFVSLEGQFPKQSAKGLEIKKSDSTLTVELDEAARDTFRQGAWSYLFSDGDHPAEISIILPRQFSGRLKIETVSGSTKLSSLSLGELDWKSLSGPLESHDGEIHIARLRSVSGDVEWTGDSLELEGQFTSGASRFVLKGLEHITSPKIDLQSVSGAIDVSISSQASVRLSLTSLTGETSSALELKKSMHSAGALEGRLGAGEGELRLRSVSGAVHLSTY